MTPHNQPQNEPRASPMPTPYPPPPQPHRSHDMLAELPLALLVTAAVAALGALMGVLWVWLAPRVPLLARDGSVLLGDSEGEAAVGIDGTFVLLGLGFGLLSALAVFLLRRRGGVPLVLALALGGFLASLVAWKWGIWLGPSDDVLARAREAGDGKIFDAPMDLGAKGALLAWPVAAMAMHLALTGLFGPKEAEPLPSAPQNWNGWGQPPA